MSGKGIKQIRSTKPDDPGSSMAVNDNYIFTFEFLHNRKLFP